MEVIKKMNKKTFAKNLLDFIYDSPTSFHVVKTCENILKKHGFIKLKEKYPWKLQKNNKYFVTRNNSALIAFTVGKGKIEQDGFRIIGTHGDSPALKIKPNPEMIESGRYLKLNTEVYGGPILNTWFDRPLALAGRISVNNNHPFESKIRLININKPLILIPNIAVHLNPDINKGQKIDKQKNLLPLISMVNDKFKKEEFIYKILESETGIKKEDIVDFDLYLYNYSRGEISGLDDEFISSGRLDDLAMVHAGINSIISIDNCRHSSIMAIFDNEEIGSKTQQGADSPFLATILERICLNLGKGRDEYLRARRNSFMLSADMAHALHPNYVEKHDPTNKVYINQGPVIKISANKKYTSDSDSTSICKKLCQLANIPYQIYVNRSDQKGGSTIGPVSATQLDISSVDIGNPLLAMHSIQELGGVEDHYYISKLFDRYYLC